ncbi:MAG: S8 family serine peptidase [Solirubrobacteraceae bacterium]
MALITINGVSLDPVAHIAELQAASLESMDAGDSNYILIQTDGVLTEEQQAQLTELGVVIHEYVPEETYICGYRPSDLHPIRELPFVTWVNVYLKGFKIAPSLRGDTPEVSASILAVAPLQTPSRKLHEVDVVLHEGVDAGSEEVADQIAAAAGLDPSSLHTGQHKVRMMVQENRLDTLADLDAVRQIEEVPERQLFNNVARPILAADVSVNGTQYRGEGQIVAVADTGFDRGSTKDVHPAFTGRVAKLYALGRKNPAKSDDPNGHGTHVAGSVLGDGKSATMGGAIQGTAPRATLVLQSTLDSSGHLGGLPTDLHDLFEPPYHNDSAHIHTNSWGATRAGLAYDASATEIDDVVWKHQDLAICFAAGNEGVDGDGNGIVDRGSIGSQSAAKNCITIGASESVRRDFPLTYGQGWPSEFSANPIYSDHIADKAEGMVAFSSRGPTKERRIKPDVVAPGTCILSTLSRAVVHPSTEYGKSSDKLFFFDSGTSMATPLVAGCVAVLRETLVKNGTPKPSAALLKALLINGAVELAGQYSPTEAGASPNNSSGFGRVDLAGSVIIPGPNPDSGLGEGGPLKQGGEDTIDLTIPKRAPAGEPHDQGQEVDAPTVSAGVTLKVTLVWSDPPGAALQNDLDLIVRSANGQERHGNMGTSKAFDRQNNVEQIVWTGIPPGKAEIVIRAHRITQNAQPYAYAWRLG